MEKTMKIQINFKADTSKDDIYNLLNKGVEDQYFENWEEI